MGNGAHCERASCNESRRPTFRETFAVENNSKSTKGVCVPGSYLALLVPYQGTG